MPKKPKSGEQPCPACKEPCSFEAIICPHCRTAFTPEQIAARKKTESDTKKAGLIGCGGLIAIILLIGMCSSASKDEGEADQADAIKTSMAVAGTNKGAPGSAKLETIALYKSVVAKTRNCDAATSTMADTTQGGDVVAAYRAADRAADACLETGSELKALKIPASLGGEDRETVEKSMEACHTAYVMKWSGARKLKDVIDGDSSPSAIADLQETTETMQAGQLMCVGGLIAVATSLGATEAELGIEDRKAKK